MKLTVLVDNQTLIDRYYRGEPGVSYWIEVDGKSILFDTGYSDLFLENGRKMGHEPTLADYVVLSHGHNDHSWGLGPLVASMTEKMTERGQNHRPVLVGHPEVLKPKRYDDLDIGSLLGVDSLERHLQMCLQRTPYPLTEHLIWLGEIPRIHSFEPEAPIGEMLTEGQWKPDGLLDDSALVYTGEQGLVIITGCSHAGICNIISHAQAVTGESRIQVVLGGFHLLMPDPPRWEATRDFLVKNKVQALYAGHCTGFEARAFLARTLNHHEIGVGIVLEF